ncbi:MAG: DMT family transporter [Verrucomicrobiota bacterium]|nr:DMT family transporter [Verrucomicrobiota bacterium]
MFPAILAAFLFASTAVCATRAAILLGGVRANFLRILLAVIILGIWAHTLGNGFSGGSFGLFVIAGAIGFGLGGLCMFQALPLLGSTLSLLIVECLAIVSATLFSWVGLHAALTLPQIIFASLVIAGICLGIIPMTKLPGSQRMLCQGIAWATLAAIGQGMSFTLTRLAFTQVQRSGLSLDKLTAAYQRLLGGLVVAVVVYALFTLTRRNKLPTVPFWRGAGWKSTPWIWVSLNAILGPVLGVTCMLWAISLVKNPGLVQAVAASATLISVPLSKPLEERSFGLNYFIGAALALAGVAGLLLSGHH